MRIKTWNKIEKSDLFMSLKLKIRQLYGREPKFSIDKKFDIVKSSGWALPIKYLSDNDVIYSLGVCDDIEFEKFLLKMKNLQIHTFDPTPYSVNWIKGLNLPENLHFYPWAGSGVDGSYFLYPLISKNGKKSTTMYSFHEQEKNRDDGISVEAFTVETITKKLGHTNVDILKMDIEGAE